MRASLPETTRDNTHEMLRQETLLHAGQAQLEADPVRLRQVIHNLVKNALEAVESLSDPQIIISTDQQDRDEGVSLVLEVQDNGKGFDEETP